MIECFRIFRNSFFLRQGLRLSFYLLRDNTYNKRFSKECSGIWWPQPLVALYRLRILGEARKNISKVQLEFIFLSHLPVPLVPLSTPQPASGFSLVLLKRFEEAIQPIKEGLRRNEDVPYGLNALGNMSEAKEFKGEKW